MLGYLKANPVPIIPLYKASYRSNALFAKRGQDAPDNYEWDVFMEYVNELKGALRLAVSLFAAVEDVLLWRWKSMPFSIGLCIGYQFLVGHPHYIPAASCVVGLIFLAYTHTLPADSLDPSDGRLDTPIHARSSFFAIVGALVGRSPPPLTAKPDVVDKETSDFKRGFKKRRFWTARGAANYLQEDLKASTESYWREKILGDDNMGKEGEDSMQESAKELTEKKAKVRSRLRSAHVADSSHPAHLLYHSSQSPALLPLTHRCKRKWKSLSTRAMTASRRRLQRSGSSSGGSRTPPLWGGLPTE